MNKKLLGVIIAVIILISGVAIAVAMYTGSPATAPQGKDRGSQASIKATSDSPKLTYTDDGFDPEALSVASGTVIRVVNGSSSALQFSSGPHPSHQGDPELNMGIVPIGQEGAVKVTIVGAHTFHNHFNEEHGGVLTVTKQ